MNFKRSFLVGAIAWCVCLSATGAFGQGRRGMGGHAKPVRPERAQRQPQESKAAKEAGAPLEEFQKMTPQQREQQLSALPPDRREKLERQLQKYDSLSPAQKEQVDWFNHLPPERQNSFRKAFQKFQKEAPARQQAMREELGRLRAMPDVDRDARISSPEFRNNYSKKEQQILAELAEALPK